MAYGFEAVNFAEPGFVRRIAGTRPTSTGFLQYRLLQDLGEIAPTLRPKRGVLHDHNGARERPLGFGTSIMADMASSPRSSQGAPEEAFMLPVLPAR